MTIVDLNNLDYSLCPTTTAISVDSWKVSNHVTWLVVDGEASTNHELQLNNPQHECVHFIYNLMCSIDISTKSSCVKNIPKFESALVLHDDTMDSGCIKLKKNSLYQTVIIEVRKYSDTGLLNDNFKNFDVIFPNSKKIHLVHTGIPNLELLHYVEQVMKLPKNETYDKLITLGYIYMIFGIKIKQYLNFEGQAAAVSLLTNRELNVVRKIAFDIENNPHHDYKIEELCKNLCINASKLQIGIKEIYGTTVRNFITNIRLGRALKLLKENNLTVSEIVYELGWTSRSYFSKIFKEKYNCTPREYQSKVMQSYLEVKNHNSLTEVDSSKLSKKDHKCNK